MKKFELNIDWNFFKIKFKGQETDAFEKMCYLLFLSETGNRQGLFRYKNHPGIETEPVTYNNKLTGFQAKYLSSLSDGKSNIIESINTTISHYPLLKVYYIYTNCEPGANYTSSDLKPQYISDIENAAKTGGMSVVWRVPSHIEAQLALPQNRYIYDIFFGDVKSDPTVLLDEIEAHNNSLLAPIKDVISFHDSSIHIDRNETSENILSGLAPGSVTIISGEGGSGKTALFKQIYNNHYQDFPIVIFKAAELKCSRADEIFEFNHKLTFQWFLDVFKEEDKKIFVIDSAERLAELDNTDILLSVFQKLIANKWSLVFLTRTVYKSILLTILKDGFGITPSLTEIPLLEEKELKEIALNHNFNLPENPRFLSRLRNLFYLREYLANYDNIDRKGSDGDFINLLWEKIIQGTSIKNGLNVSRDKCLITIARQRADSGNFYIDGDGLPSEALFALRQDEILSLDIRRNEYFITHDIYEEWALRKIIDREWEKAADCNSFFDLIGDSLPMRKAFRMWLLDKLQESDVALPSIIKEAFDEPELPRFWLDDILVACLLSDKASQFFTLFEDRIIADDYSLLKRTLFLLQIACMIPNRLLCDIMEPTGKGWEAAIYFMHKYPTDFFEKNIGLCIPVLKSWVSSNKKGSATMQAGELAFSILDNAIKSEAYFSDDLDKQILSIIFEAASVIKDKVRELIQRIIDTPAKKKSHIMEVVCEMILVESYRAFVVIHELPDEVLALGESWWTYSPVHNEEDRDEDDFILRGHILSQENKFGLSNNISYHYFPASANQTPILHLLYASPLNTLDFIIRFINHFVENFYKSGYDQGIEIVQLNIDGTIRKQYCSGSLWECYRGTGSPVVPYFIQSIHMALEKFLLHVFDKYDTADVKWMLEKILTESKSASLSAIVASIVAKYPDKLPDIAMILFRVPQFIELDTIRQIHEPEAKSLTIMGATFRDLKNEFYVKERLKECDDAHRKDNLEGLILKYQYVRTGCMDEDEQKEFIARIHKIIDGFKKNKAVMKRMSNIIERIDRRNLDAKIVGKTEEGTVIQFNPIHRSEESISAGEEAVRMADELLKYSSLRIWSSPIQPDPQTQTAKMAEYNEHPEQAMADLKALLAEMENMSEDAYFMNQKVPFRVASRLLREFQEHISSADRDSCRDIVLQGFQNAFHPQYVYQEGDGTKEAIFAIPHLLTLYPDEADDLMLGLAFSMLRTFDGRFWRIKCRIIPEAIIQSGLWEKYSEKAKTIIAYYLELQKLAYSEKEKFYDALKEIDSLNGTLTTDNIDCADIYVLYNILSSLPVATKDELILSIYEKICRELPYRFLNEIRRKDDPENNQYDKGAFTDVRFDIFQKLARFMLSLDTRDQIKRYFNPLIEKAGCCSHTDTLIQAIIIENEKARRPDQFLILWELLYPKILTYKTNSHLQQTLLEYLLAASYWEKDVREWHSFTPGMLKLFEKASIDLCDIDTTLFCMAKVFQTIGSKNIDEGLTCIHNIVKNNNISSRSRWQSNALYYMEQFINRYWLQRSKKIRENSRTRTKIKEILTHMMEQGSAKAYRLRDLL